MRCRPEIDHSPTVVANLDFVLACMAPTRASRSQKFVIGKTPTADTAGDGETPPAWDPLGAAPFAWDLPEPAAATVLALEHPGPAVYNIVDDDPAPVRDWLPHLAPSTISKQYAALYERVLIGLEPEAEPVRGREQGQAESSLSAKVPTGARP